MLFLLSTVHATLGRIVEKNTGSTELYTFRSSSFTRIYFHCCKNVQVTRTNKKKFSLKFSVVFLFPTHDIIHLYRLYFEYENNSI